MAIRDLNSLSKQQLIDLILKEVEQKDAAGKTIIELQNNIKEISDTLSETSKEVKRLSELVIYYELQMYTKHRLRLEDTNQPTLFDVMEVEEPTSVTLEEGKATTVAEHKRQAHPKTGNLDYSSLPHEIAPGESEKAKDVICPLCEGPMRCYKTEKREELVFIPASAKVVVHYIHYYKCEHCVDDADHSPCRVDENGWKPLFKQSICSSSLLASVIDYKYDLGLPLYAIERNYRENGIVLPRQNMSNWLIASMKYIEPLYNLMHKDLLAQPIICADETPLSVLREEGRRADQTSYLWLYQSTTWDKRIVLYDYEPGRSGDFAAEFLRGFSGIILTDKYSGYNKVGVKRAYCHIHAMRQIRESYEILPKGTRNKSVEHEAYKKYQHVFKVDNDIYKEAEKLYPEDINKQLEYVQEHRIATKQAFEEFSLWLEEIKPQVVMKPKFTRAITYILNENSRFQTFMEDSRIPLGNNSSEQLFRNFVVIRNRSKFFVSTKGAAAAAKIYSLLMTAKENGYGTFAYFKYIFDELRFIDLTNEEELRKFLPYEGQIPDHCKMRTMKELKQKIKSLEDDSNK